MNKEILSEKKKKKPISVLFSKEVYVGEKDTSEAAYV